MTKKTYKILGMHCASCAMLIEGELEDIGVKARCHYATQSLEAEFDADAISESDIMNAVGKAGYRVDVSKPAG